MIWATSTDQYQREQDYSDQDQHLHTRQTELDFSKESNAKVVYEEDRGQKHRDENARIHLFSWDPVLKNQSKRRELVRSAKQVLEEISIPKRRKCQLCRLSRKRVCVFTSSPTQIQERDPHNELHSREIRSQVVARCTFRREKS